MALLGLPVAALPIPRGREGWFNAPGGRTVTFEPKPSWLHARLPQFASAAGWIAIGCGAAVLVGWQADVDRLKRIVPGLVSMNPLTAVAFMLAGVSLWLLRHPPGAAVPGTARRAGQLAAAAVAVIGLTKVLSYLGLIHPPIDQLLYSAKLELDGTTMPNRMAPNTALNFLLLGGALLTIDRAGPRGGRPGQLLAVAVALISLLALMGYAYGVRWLYGFAAFIPMALHTAALFHVLALGTLAARPQDGIMGLFTSDSPGGTLVRRLLPGMVTVFFMVGWVRLEGEKRGYYGTELGVALFTSGSIALVGGLIVLAGRSLHRTDLARRREEAERERFFSLSLDLLAIATRDGVFRRVNPAFTATLGHPTDALLALPWRAWVHPDDRDRLDVELARLAQGGATLHLENRHVRHDGSHAWISWKIQFAPEEGLFYATGHDVTDERAAAEAIRTLNDDLRLRARQLEEANRELEAFSYSVSHDLRAPLRHIQGYAEMLAAATRGQLAEKPERYLRTISQAAEEMGRLIDDLLAFSRMGRSELRPGRVALLPLVHETIAGLEMLTRGRSLTWSIADLPEVQGDAAMLRQVLVNLIGNALKYTRRKPSATIEIGMREGDLGFRTFFVRDDGAGFDMRYVDKLFGVFQRLHRADEFEGTGIGLAIVRRVIARHGGRVWAEGEPGRGATFFFTLKPAEPEPATLPLQPCP